MNAVDISFKLFSLFIYCGCFLAILYISSRILLKEGLSRNTYSILVLNAVILVTVFVEILLILSLGNESLSHLLSDIYMICIYWLLLAVLFALVSLNDKTNFILLVIFIGVGLFVTYLHLNVEVVKSYTTNGIFPVRVAGAKYWIFELFTFSVSLLILVFMCVRVFSKKANIRSRAIIVVFGILPAWMMMTVIGVYMKYSYVYTTAGLDAILFLWMNLFLLFASNRMVVDLSLKREYLKAYGMILKAASLKEATLMERMTYVESAWYLLADASTEGDIDEVAKKLGVPVIEAEQKLEKIRKGKYLQEELARIRQREFNR